MLVSPVVMLVVLVVLSVLLVILVLPCFYRFLYVLSKKIGSEI